MRIYLLTLVLLPLPLGAQQLIKLDSTGKPKEFRKSASAPWIKLHRSVSTASLSIYTPQWNASDPDESKGFEFDTGEFELTIVIEHLTSPRFEMQRVTVFPAKQIATIYAAIPLDAAGNKLPDPQYPVDSTLPLNMLDTSLRQALDSSTKEIAHTLPTIMVAAPATACQDLHNSLRSRNIQDITPPKTINRVIPMFPPEARLAHFSGKVLSRLVVDTDGLPRCIRILSPVSNDLQQSVFTAISQSRFTPAPLAGKPVRFEITIANSFEVH